MNQNDINAARRLIAQFEGKADGRHNSTRLPRQTELPQQSFETPTPPHHRQGDEIVSLAELHGINGEVICSGDAEIESVTLHPAQPTDFDYSAFAEHLFRNALAGIGLPERQEITVEPLPGTATGVRLGFRHMTVALPIRCIEPEPLCLGLLTCESSLRALDEALANGPILEPLRNNIDQ